VLPVTALNTSDREASIVAVFAKSIHQLPSGQTRVPWNLGSLERQAAYTKPGSKYCYQTGHSHRNAYAHAGAQRRCVFIHTLYFRPSEPVPGNRFRRSEITVNKGRGIQQRASTDKSQQALGHTKALGWRAPP